MQNDQPIPVTRDLVLIGGGHTHALVLNAWAKAALPGARVTLINPQAKALYTGMLPGHIAGHYSRDALDIDLVKLARRAGARLIVDRADGIDREGQRVHLAGRSPIAFDVLSIDIGVTSALHQVPGFAEHATPAKPLGPFANAWTNLLRRQIPSDQPFSIVIIGAGVAGVELALSMAHRLKSGGEIAANIHLIDADEEPLRNIGAATRRKLLSELKRQSVKLIFGAAPTEITPEAVKLSAAPYQVPAQFVVSAAGASPHAWLTETGLDLERGYIAVGKDLQSQNTPDIFAVGDCAHFEPKPLAKSGVYAVRQAPVLLHNLKAALSGQAMTVYRPQGSFLKLITTGGKSAVADKWGRAISGRWAWRWKTQIDEAFMQKFRTPPVQFRQQLPAQVASGVKDLMTGPECGGCGAKVARTPLLKGLSQTDPDVSDCSQMEMDDAVIVRRGDVAEVYTTDHLRAFGFDPWMLARIAAVHALGDIWAMGAEPETILSNITLPPLSPDKQAQMIKEIMSGAGEIFADHGVRVAGGHTSSGAELSIGFSITGKTRGKPILQSGANVGDALILTKPIGTGVLLAAEMRQCVDGDAYQVALASMCRSMKTPARILADSASAMTDVTGFGLAGHLITMLEASSVAASIRLGDVPFLPTAVDLFSSGVRSSLWPANADVRAQMTAPNSPKTDLLFDPQTCGGLLATIPSESLGAVRSAFEAAGEPIWYIGDIVSGSPHLTVIDS